MGTQSQSQGRGQSQSQSQGPKHVAPAPQRQSRVTDEDELEAGGPDALDAADEEPHPDSPPGSRRDQVEDPHRSTGAEDRSNSM